MGSSRDHLVQYISNLAPYYAVFNVLYDIQVTPNLVYILVSRHNYEMHLNHMTDISLLFLNVLVKGDLSPSAACSSKISATIREISKPLSISSKHHTTPYLHIKQASENLHLLPNNVL